ncbi:putative glutamate synthase (ferredoxin) [Helianthus anomalus]
MGANEYGFDSIAMIVIGCVIARICNTNDCLAGVVSQVSAMKMGGSVGLVMGQNGYLYYRSTRHFHQL